MIPAAVWDGNDLLNAFALATELLVENRATIDALNVYPVPDGDTGTNMSLTMEAALAEGRKASLADSNVHDVAQRIAHGALLGARGNSGVILSQIWRGFANEVSSADKIDGRDLSRGLRGATEVAYKAVMKPVEGTMLTVIRVAAEHAEQVAVRDPSLDRVLEAAVNGAKIALADTPNLLSTLRDAGVVDSGGQGVVLTLEGFLAAARGSEPDTSVLTMSGLPTLELHGDEHDTFGYCTNFMISGEAIPFEAVRSELAAMGQSAVIVGDERTVKVHIHTENPGRTLDYAVAWGSLSQIKIDNMNAQADVFAGRRPDTEFQAPAGRAIVAVASGAGISEAFASLGVENVLSGGSSMNPSIDELLRAVEIVNATEVILLPNDGNVLLAAGQVPALSKRNVTVLPTRSIVQGLAAVSAFNDEQPLDQVVARMQRASDRATTIEISRADKNALADGISVVRGQFIGLVNDHLVAAADDIVGLTATTLGQVMTDKHELITVFTGAELVEADQEIVSATIRSTCPDIDIEIVAGGQPHYLLIISVE